MFSEAGVSPVQRVMENQVKISEKISEKNLKYGS